MGINPDFHLPTRIHIQPGIISNTGAIISGLGSRAIIVTTAHDLEIHENVLVTLTKSIENAGINCIIYDEIPDFPNSELIDSATYFTKKTFCDIIIGFGGIESINSAKAIALLSNNYLFCDDLFNNPKVEKPLTFITIPSKPIFGFEILPIFMTKDIQEEDKKVYMNNDLYPYATIIDPNVSTSSTDEETANSGMSIISIAVESIISKITSEFTNTYALKSIDLAFKNLKSAFKDPSNIKYRVPLSTSSVLCGVSFSISYLSTCLAIGLSLSSKKNNISIEQAIGVLLPHIMEYYLTSSPAKYVQMAKVMEEDVREITVIEAAIKAIEAVRRLSIDIDLPQRLSEFGFSKKEFSAVADLAIGYQFIKNSPRPLSKDEIETILIAAY